MYVCKERLQMFLIVTYNPQPFTSYFPNRYCSSGSGAQCFLALLSIREAFIWLSATRSSLRESRGQVSQDHLAVPQYLIVGRLSAHHRILGFHMSSL